MPLYRFCFETFESASDMDVGFCRDEAPLPHAVQIIVSAEIEICRASTHVPTMGALVELSGE
jgi:hypothetical protein